EDAAHRLFGIAIGNRDRCRVSLALRGNGFAEMRPDGLTSGIGETVREGNLGGKVHDPAVVACGSPAGMLSGSPSSCTRRTIARMPSGPARGVWTFVAGMTAVSPGPSVCV